MDWCLVFGLILLGLGLLIVRDDYTFKRRSVAVEARVLSSERVVTRINEGQGSDGRFKHREHVRWKTRFAFLADGKRHEKEDESPTPPGETITVWYDRENPYRVRIVRSRVHLGWTAIFTSLIPFGFYLLSVLGVMPS